MADRGPVQLSLIGGGPDDEPTIVDQDARDEVTDALDRTLFVEAGAGSGKTRALVDRVESLVLDGMAMESIAAITFTEKAAAELRDRIRQRFEEQIAEGTHRDLFETALEQLDGAAVGTLHSFAQRILSEHPVEAGLPPGVEVLDEIGSQVEFESRWVRFVDRLLDDEDLGRSLLVLESARVRIHHLRSLALALGANWDLVAERLDLDPPDPDPVDATRLIDRLAELAEICDRCTDEDDRLLIRLGELAEVGNDLAGLDDEPDKIATIRGIESLCKVGRVGVKTNWGGDVQSVRASVTELGEIASGLADDVTRQALRRLGGALGRFILEAADERRAQGRLEFHDLLVRARRLLRDPEIGWSVRRALRERYRRLLIDEFQDTDPIQLDLAILLASPDADASTGSWADARVDDGRLFFVGDPKQSIYRFRRADISVYLQARDRFTDRPELVLNFRSVAPVIDWINHVFENLIVAEPGSQPPYASLVPYRTEPPPTGPGVAVLGFDPIEEPLNAERLREREALAVARAVGAALADGWSVQDEEAGGDEWRPARAGDICILLPARTSLAALERALDAHSIPYRAETSSLVYTSREVRDVLIALRAVADPTDELATVAALRSSIYGCGDDDLAHWRLGLSGRFSILVPRPDDHDPDHPVGEGLAHLSTLHQARLWSTPSQLLDRIIRERGVLESAVAGGRPRDVWRRLRFVVDQARAWADAGGTDLRAYLDWAHLQGADNARVTETVLPETDDDSVRIMTVHGAKGLEFPIAVLAGMTTELRRPASQPGVAFPPESDPVFRVRTDVRSEGYEKWQPIDEQMDHHERLRLLYVATTRARDHLVVSLIRGTGTKTTGASILAGAGATTTGALALDPERTAAPVPDRPTPTPLIDRDEWRARRTEALADAGRRRVIAATTLAREAAETADPGLAKRERDLELPPWNKGRYGTAVGRAVHGVLQVVDLVDGKGLTDAATAQAAAEGVASRTDVVIELASSALATGVARDAARSEHWRELWVAAPVGDRLVEGYIDLLYRSETGLVVVDWKTDHVEGDDDVAAKIARYRLQGASYVAALEAATGESVARMVFVFLQPDGAVEVDLPDLADAVAEVEARAASAGLDDLVTDIDD